MADLVTRSHGAAVADPSSRARQRTVIVVVGMHRSGTSFCSQMLSLQGVDMASEVSADEGNATGHFERWEIMDLQNEVLALFNRGYYAPTHDFPLPPGWWMDFRLRPIKDRIKALLAPFVERAEPFGFKDPRTARLMPLWHQVFAELELTPRFVVCLRDPAHVGISLNTREKLDREAGEQRALDYMVDAVRFTRDRDRCFIRYDDWLREPMHNATKLLEFVGPQIGIDAQDLEIAVESLFREDLNRSGRSPAKARQPLVRTFYDLVDRFAESDGGDAALGERIDHFIHNYIAFRQLLRPFEAHVSAAIDARVAAEGQLAAAQSELAAERATSARLDEAHSGAVARATQAEATMAGRIAELTGAQETLASALTTADAERARLVEAHRVLEAEKDQAVEAHRALAAEKDQAQLAFDAERARLVEAQRALETEKDEAQRALEAERARKSRRGLGSRLFGRA